MYNNSCIGTLVSCRPKSEEYAEVMPKLEAVVKEHKAKLVPGEPQLNYCDRALMVRAHDILQGTRANVRAVANRMAIEADATPYFQKLTPIFKKFPGEHAPRPF